MKMVNATILSTFSMKENNNLICIQLSVIEGLAVE
jgi:hypothetical protein